MRGFVKYAAIALVVLCVVAAICAPMHGYTDYEDRRDCIGDALGRVFAFEHSDHEPCTPDWAVTGERRALPWQGLLVLLPMAAAGVLLARRPRARWAALWSGLTLGGAFALFVATFELDIFSGKRTVSYWPGEVVAWSAVSFLFIHLIVLLTCGVYGIVWLVRRRRARRLARELAEPAPLPQARVVKD